MGNFRDSRGRNLFPLVSGPPYISEAGEYHRLYRFEERLYHKFYLKFVLQIYILLLFSGL